MSIPDFQTAMLPLLQHLSDGQEHVTQETVEVLARYFHLSDEERAVLLPSGRQPLFNNRVAWAKSYLKGAGLLESPRRGVYRITARGREVLDEKPKAVNLSYLSRFPEYRAFRARGQEKEATPASQSLEGTDGDDRTPEEYLELGYERLRSALASELLERIKTMPPDFFERLVVDLLVRMGYGGTQRDAGQAIGKGGDEGIDGIIKEDRLGLETIYIQAKRWDNTVGRPEIQRFAGALQGQRARKGVFITTSSFSSEARNYASTIPSTIVLIDGEQLAELMIDHGVGVTQIATYEVKRLDSDYFSTE
ncbi:MAG TPA: restriction endonuclease [Acidobacteriaceae bacterium]|nr:restriction endonuclease [Acidobacteriaceae bacterium]